MKLSALPSIALLAGGAAALVGAVKEELPVLYGPHAPEKVTAKLRKRQAPACDIYQHDGSGNVLKDGSGKPVCFTGCAMYARTLPAVSLSVVKLIGFI